MLYTNSSNLHRLYVSTYQNQRYLPFLFLKTFFIALN